MPASFHLERRCTLARVAGVNALLSGVLSRPALDSSALDSAADEEFTPDKIQEC